MPRRSRAVIDVDILGQIFEQSITNLERLCENLQPAGRASVPASPNFSQTPANQGSRGRSPSQEAGRTASAIAPSVMLPRHSATMLSQAIPLTALKG